MVGGWNERRENEAMMSSDIKNALVVSSRWQLNPGHRQWLIAGAHRLIDFYQHAILDPGGGFFELDDDGRPFDDPGRHLVTTTRMTHTFALAHLLGHPGAAPLVDHGIRSLRSIHLDPVHGGYYWIA